MPGTKSAKEFSPFEIVVDSISDSFPIPGSHTLEKLGNKKVLEGTKSNDELLDGDSARLVVKKERPFREVYKEAFFRRKDYEKEYKSDGFNRIWRPRNLMSGKDEITVESRLKNASRDAIGWHESKAPFMQQVVNKVSLALFGIPKAIRLTVSITRRLLRLPIDIAKFPLVILPKIIYRFAYQGTLAAADKIKEAQASIKKRENTVVSFSQAFAEMNLTALGGYLADYAKIVAFALLTGASAVVCAIFRVTHFVTNAALAPRENFRELWNNISEKEKETASGKVLDVVSKMLAVLSLITTITIYALAAFFLAPLAMQGLMGMAIANAGTPFGAFVSNIFTGISHVASALSTVTAPIGAWLTTALETAATFLPFLGTAAAAAGNAMAATLGLFTLGGAAVALTGTTGTMIAGAINDEYHSHALAKVIKKDVIDSTRGLLDSMDPQPKNDPKPRNAKTLKMDTQDPAPSTPAVRAINKQSPTSSPSTATPSTGSVSQNLFGKFNNLPPSPSSPSSPDPSSPEGSPRALHSGFVSENERPPSVKKRTYSSSSSSSSS